MLIYIWPPTSLNHPKISLNLHELYYSNVHIFIMVAMTLIYCITKRYYFSSKQPLQTNILSLQDSIDTMPAETSNVGKSKIDPLTSKWMNTVSCIADKHYKQTNSNNNLTHTCIHHHHRFYFRQQGPYHNIHTEYTNVKSEKLQNYKSRTKRERES